MTKIRLNQCRSINDINKFAKQENIIIPESVIYKESILEIRKEIQKIIDSRSR